MESEQQIFDLEFFNFTFIKNHFNFILFFGKLNVEDM